jgi:hypothetical protein
VYPRTARKLVVCTLRRHDASLVVRKCGQLSDTGCPWASMAEIVEPTAIFSLITGSARDPVPIIAQLREHDPVCWLPGFEAWLVTRHEDVRLLFVDPRVTSDPRAYEGYTAPTVPGAERWLTEMPFRSTPSNPESLGRRLVMAALTPRAAERAAARIREVVDQFAAPLRSRRDVVDLRGEFAAPVSPSMDACSEFRRREKTRSDSSNWRAGCREGFGPSFRTSNGGRRSRRPWRLPSTCCASSRSAGRHQATT